MYLLVTSFTNLIILSGLVYLIFRRYKSVVDPRLFLVVLGLKLTAGVVLGLLYFFYYEGGDTWYYYNMASAIAEKPWHSFWSAIFEPTVSSSPVRAIYFTRLLSVLLYLTKANYWMASFYFSVFSFYCGVYCYEAIRKWKPAIADSAFIALFLFPTAVFWSSGILKESLAFGAILVIAGFYMKGLIPAKRKFLDYSLLIISLLILLVLKYYLLAIVLPLFMYLMVFEYMSEKGWLDIGFWMKSTVIALVMVVPTIVFLNWLHPNFELQEFLRVIQFSHGQLLHNSTDANGLKALVWFENGFDIVVNIPYFLVSGIFRPLPFESFSLLGIISSLENTVVFILIIWKMKTFKFDFGSPSPQFFIIVIYILVLSLFLSYSIPNLGALARFKVYYIPFLLWLLLIDHPVMDKISKLKIIR